MDFTLPVPIAEFLPKYEAAYVPCRSPKHSLQALEGRQQPMEWRGKAVQQTDMSQLPQHTRDLLRSIMDAKNTVQIHKQVCSSYQGDGKDFNVYYKVLLENLWTNERSHKRKVHQRDDDAYSAHVYQQGSKTLLYLLQGLGHRQAGDLIYNAYASILQDKAIDREHRIALIQTIEPRATRFRLLKALQSSLYRHDIPVENLDQAEDGFWKDLNLERPLPFVQDLLSIFLSTEPEKRQEGLLAVLQGYIHSQESRMDWEKCREQREQIGLVLIKLAVCRKEWSAPFVELVNKVDLRVEDRLYAFYCVMDQEAYTASQEALWQSVLLHGHIEFFRAFLELGYEEEFVNFINQSPETIPLSALDRFYQAKLHAIEALSELHDAAIARLTGLDEHLSQIESLREAIESLVQQKLAINSTYPLYKIILQKRACVCQLESLIEAKKDTIATDVDLGDGQDTIIYLNHQAYALPQVFDPEWQDGYEAITFNFFLEKIEAAMNSQQAYHNLTANDTAVPSGYRAVLETWKDILTDPRYRVVKTLLDAQEADDNAYVLKLTALAAGIIQLFEKGSYEKAQSLMDTLVFNLQTCEGGQLQAIDHTYSLLVKEHYQSINDPKERALNIVLNSLYVIRKNWVMEDEIRYTEAGKMVKYSPRVADGVFINALTAYLNQEELMTAYQCDEAGLARYTFLKHRNPSKDAFGRTHIGHDIIGIAGVELGLIGEGPPVYEFNITADSWFLKNTVSDKVSILSAFVDSFTFETIWQPLAELIWRKAAEESSFGSLVYKDKACTQNLNLDIYEDHEGILARQDPLAKGIVRFLDQLGLNPDVCCETMDVYYKDPLYEEIDSIRIYTRLNKRGVTLILKELGLLTVEAKA